MDTVKHIFTWNGDMFWEKTQEKESKKVHKIKQISVY